MALMGIGEEYYKESEDPKAVVNGVALVTILAIIRQLGDLALFGAEIFHGLQEQVASTSSRSRRVVSRIQRVESSLPSFEKAILSQTDHLRLAYTTGIEWHASIKDEQNHFIYNDLPHSIMDSYEECKEPPRLHLLDRFDMGGSGSCLKRYTDPTFFRRASSCSEDCNTEKSQQERKARKTKKRRSWQRSEKQFPKSGSILYGSRSGRMQFLSIGQGQSSLSHTNSTFDTTFKSDIGDQSDSRGSKDGIDLIDIISRPSISTQPFATKNKGLSSAVWEAEVNTNKVEETSHNSSCTTWDEKPDIPERTDGNHDIEDELCLVNKKDVSQANDICDAGSFPTTGDGTLMDRTKPNCGPREILHFLKSYSDPQEHHLKPVYVKRGSQLLDISEGNHAEDTFLEGEASLDGGKNVKLIKGNEWEVETQNDENFSQVEVIEWDPMDEIDSATENFVDAMYTIESGSESDFQTEMKVQETSLEDEETVIEVSDQMREMPSHDEPEQENLSASYHHEDELKELEKSTCSVDFTHSSHKFESTSDQKLDVISQNNSPFNVPKDLDSCANEPEIRLEPSIPEIRAPIVTEELSIGSSSTYPLAFRSNGTLLGLQPSRSTVKGSENHDVLGIYDPDVGSFKHLSHQRFENSHGKPMGNDNGKLQDHSFLDLNNGKATPLESKIQVGTNMKSASLEGSIVTEDRSSLLFLLSHGLLKNRRESSSPSNTNESVNKFQDSAVFDTKQGKLSSPVHSPPPSPPLEHMKISFQPVHEFDTSRLKLKYPDRVDQTENNLDAFPSFQMVQESTSMQHIIGSDSDDDTFCQSHAYKSDGSHSHMSASDSEQWEFGDATKSNNLTLYNVPLSGSSFGLEILDDKNREANRDMKLCLKPAMDSSYIQNSTHEPPPLPPLQWRVSQPQFHESEGNQGRESDLSQQISDSDFAHPPRVDSTKLTSIIQESTTNGTLKKVEEQKTNKEQTCRADKELIMDDEGDFLQQIRTKSFNLRPKPARSTHMPPPTTNIKITAILQKANAIRQAVGSDGGDDDSWSDT